MAKNERVICASVDLIDGGKGMRFDVARFGRQEPAFVIRYQGRVFAYYNRCAHVPIEMDCNAGEFFDHSGLYLICATHGALYHPATGRCQMGRCDGRGLEALNVLEQDGHVYLMQEGE